MTVEPSDDPHEVLITKIASDLRERGEYVAEVAATPNQRIVDLHWASLLAGRRLGVRTRVDVQQSGSGQGGSRLRVTVVCVDRLGQVVTHVSEAARAVTARRH
jgi:hypothetical protein